MDQAAVIDGHAPRRPLCMELLCGPLRPVSETLDSEGRSDLLAANDAADAEPPHHSSHRALAIGTPTMLLPDLANLVELQVVCQARWQLVVTLAPLLASNSARSASASTEQSASPYLVSTP